MGVCKVSLMSVATSRCSHRRENGGGDCLLGGDFRAGQYSGNLAFAEAEGGVLQVTGGPVFARLLFFEVAEFELMLTGAAFGYFYGCRLVGEIDSTVFVRWTCGW